MKKLFFVLFIAFSFQSLVAQDRLTKIWYNEEKDGKIRVFKATDGKFYGKIVWLKEPTESNGEPKKDKENPDPKLKSRPVMEMQLLSGLEKKSETEYINGRIYDPKNGKTYGCKITIINDKQLNLRGFIIGFPLLGRTSKWTLAD
jgi:uncharacterized protein (DUF2147 family)